MSKSKIGILACGGRLAKIGVVENTHRMCGSVARSEAFRDIKRKKTRRHIERFVAVRSSNDEDVGRVLL